MMDPEAFRLQLPHRKNGRIRLAQFELTRPTFATHVARRAKLLGALTGLSKRQRDQFGTAASKVVRCLLDQFGRVHSEWLLQTDEGRYRLVVRLQVPASANELGDVQEARARLEAVTQRIAALVDECAIKAAPHFAVGVQLGQVLPVAFTPPGKSDLSDWRAILEQPRIEEGLRVLYQRSRDKIALLAEATRRAQLSRSLSDETTEAETLTLLSLVASKTDNAVAILDAMGVVEWVNDAFSRITGFPAADAIGCPLERLFFGPDAVGPDVERYRQSIRAAKSLTEERLQCRADGESYWGTSSLTPVLDEEQRLIRWIVIGSDTTRRRQAQQALELAKAEAEAANRAKSEFLANMSHEIRTPMNGIIGMTELALNTPLNADQYDYLSTVKSSAESLLQLLNDVLDLSKIEAARLEIEEIEFNLADLLRDTMRTMAVQADAKRLELIWHLPLDVPQNLGGDPARLRQILINLVGNAIKFTERGEVVVDVHPQWQNDHEISLIFNVQDTGIGIPTDRLEQIFDAFTQVDASTTRNYGGTGLGLAISAQLLRLMNGRIWVESELDKGSKFSFSLRLMKAPKLGSEGRDLSDERLLHKRVLVVDDNATNRKVLLEFLRHWGMQVTAVGGGQSALRELSRAQGQQNPFHIVLLDAMMPDLDGFGVADKIRKLDGVHATPVMMLSSTNRQMDMTRCRQLGIGAFLTKPISPRSLHNAIVSTLEHSNDPPAVFPEVTARLAHALLTDRPLRVLIADDHPSNRRLIAGILTKRGHHFVEATNGHDALEKLGSEPIDIVLMDVQMPIMDGYQTTIAIREQERHTARHLPIIAVTAHAMKGDREKCLNTGMDAYLSKPVVSTELIRIVETLAGLDGRYVPHEPDRNSAANRSSFVKVAPMQPEDSPTYDFRPALARLANDESLLRLQMGYFVEEAPELLHEIEQSIQTSDYTALKLAAHRLRGLVLSFDHRQASELCVALEEMARAGDCGNGASVVSLLQQHINDLGQAIERYA